MVMLTKHIFRGKNPIICVISYYICVVFGVPIKLFFPLGQLSCLLIAMCSSISKFRFFYSIQKPGIHGTVSKQDNTHWSFSNPPQVALNPSISYIPNETKWQMPKEPVWSMSYLPTSTSTYFSHEYGKVRSLKESNSIIQRVLSSPLWFYYQTPSTEHSKPSVTHSKMSQNRKQTFITARKSNIKNTFIPTVFFVSYYSHCQLCICFLIQIHSLAFFL